MPEPTSRTKEADLTAAVLLYVMRCQDEGDRHALREMKVGCDEIQALKELNLDDLHRAGSLQAHFLEIRLDPNRFRRVIARLTLKREEEDLQRRLIAADAPFELMRSHFRMSNREYTRWRRLLLGGSGVGRPAEPDEETERQLWRALASRLRPDPDRPLNPEQYLEICAECGASLRAIWNAAQRWATEGRGPSGGRN